MNESLLKPFRSVRRASEGNKLWSSYKELGETKTIAFKTFLKMNLINYETFKKDSQKDRELSAIPFSRVQVYRTFFPSINWDALVTVYVPTEVEAIQNEAQEREELKNQFGFVK